MKYLNIIKKSILPLVLIAAMSSPTFAPIVHAASDNSGNISTVFIPHRCSIPYYLSTHSSDKSELVKNLWAKLFYEEQNWDSANEGFVSWIQKYHDNYIALGGEQKDLLSAAESGKITFSAGDFEAFFSNTLESNPEFLGQLMGLNGYASLSDNKSGNELMTSTIATYLLNPKKYNNYFVRAIVSVTKNGDYLTTDLLHSKSANGIPLDYCLLTTLAYHYNEKDEFGNYYLSEQQTKWVESYQLVLYDAYTKNTNATLKSLVVNYPSLYDLIARSTYAANNRNGFGQTFFNYVVASKEGAGHWLNLNNSINIPELENFDNVVTLFELSDGWCGGLKSESICYNHNNCIKNATAADKGALQLHENSVAKYYITNNTDTLAAYGKDDKSGWQNRYRIKHTKYSNGLYDAVTVNAAKYSGSGRVRCTSSSGHGTGGPRAFCTSVGVITIDSSAFLSNANTITVTAWYEMSSFWAPNTKHSDGNSEDMLSIATSNSKIQYKGSSTAAPGWNGTYNKTCTFTFDISKLSLAERQNGKITIRIAAPNGCYRSDPWHPGTDVAYANCGCMSDVTVNCTIADCDINGHKWTGSATFSDDNKTAVINYSCEKDKAHTSISSPINTVESDEGDAIVYTVSDGVNSYSKRVNKDAKKAGSEYVSVNSNNSSGTLSSKAVGTSREYPAGSKSESTFKSSSTTISGGIKQGVIKTGAKSIRLNLSFSSNLDDLSIKVLSASGKLLGENNYYDDKDKTLVDLSVATDAELKNSYIVISGKASTKNWVRGMYASIPDAVSQISVNQIIITY